MKEFALKVLDLGAKVFAGKSLNQIEEEAIRQDAHYRIKKARALCQQHGINITPNGNSYPVELLEVPAFQNYLVQLGFLHAVYKFPPQTDEPHYSLGYQEGLK